MRLIGFLRDRRGGVAPLLALSIVPIGTAVGAAVDYSRGNSARTAMQAALDAAALMLVKQSGMTAAQLQTGASSYFNANFNYPDVQNVAVTAGSSPVSGGTSVSLSATGSINTSFMAIVGISSIPLTVTSGASESADGLGCVLALDPTSSGAISGQGSTTVNLNGCSLYDNSNNPTSAMSVGGSARISAYSVGVVGGLSGAANITATQGIRTGIGAVTDPYAQDSFPSLSGCTQQNYTGKKTETINPGVYCGGMKINAGANITLNPGIYYLDGGSLSVNGGGALSGTGVTLVFTKKNSDTWATADINGNATVNLTPPKSGSTAGIVVFGDRGIPLGTVFKFNGGASQFLAGAVYVPTGAINFAGGAATSTSCTQIIGDTVTFVGNSSVAVNCSSYNTKPFSTVVVKITS